MSSTPTDIARIAEGLTKAQQEALVHASYAGFGYRRDALAASGRVTTAMSLAKRGLTRGTKILTPLGLAVRAHLLARRERG